MTTKKTRRILLLAIVLSLVLLVGWGPQGQPATSLGVNRQEPPGTEAISPFGMNAHVALRYYAKDNLPNAQETVVQRLVDARIAWTREEFCWECIEYAPHDRSLGESGYTLQADGKFGFSYEQGIPLLSARGINILGLLTYGPRTNVDKDTDPDPSYCTDWCCIDPSAASIETWLPYWREYVHYTVTQYKDQIHYWEIGNEPGALCMWRKVDKAAEDVSAADYVTVLKAASEEIRRVDPQAKIVLGGLTPEIETEGVDYFLYLKQIYDLGGWPYFDILALHPYRDWYAPEEFRPRSKFDLDKLELGDEQQKYSFVSEIEAFEQLMAPWGSKPIWLTEIGWSTESLRERTKHRTTAEPEIIQSDYLIRASVQAIAAGVQNVMWYDFRDDNVPNPTESSYGIVLRDDEMTPKPAYYAFQAMASLLEGAEFREQVRGQEDRGTAEDADVYEYRFDRGVQTVIALWKARGGDVSLEVQVDDIDAAWVRVFGPEFGPDAPYGGSEMDTVDGAIVLHLTERPVFIVFEPVNVNIDARLVEQSGPVMADSGTTHVIHFDVQNTGEVPWTGGQDFVLKVANDQPLGAPPTYVLQNDVPVGQVTRWEIALTAPDRAGSYRTAWQMQFRGEPFGPVMSGLVLVKPQGEIDFDPVTLLTEWFDELLQQFYDRINTLWENLLRGLEERFERELDRLWRQVWDDLNRQCCGSLAILPPVVVLGTIGLARQRRKKG